MAVEVLFHVDPGRMTHLAGFLSINLTVDVLSQGPVRHAANELQNWILPWVEIQSSPSPLALLFKEKLRKIEEFP